MHDDDEQTPDAQDGAEPASNPTAPPYPMSQDERDEVQTRFTHHAPKAGQPERYSYLRMTARHLAMDIMENVPPSRERSLALTNLEEALMWANAGIARNE